MKFNIMAVIFMMIAIALGNIVGAMIAGWIGLAGGFIGIFVTGLVIYGIYAYLTGQKMQIFSGLLFAGLVWISGLITGFVSGATGLGGGLIGLGVQAIILGFLVGRFLGGASPVSDAKKQSTGKRKKRRR